MAGRARKDREKEARKKLKKTKKEIKLREYQDKIVRGVNSKRKKIDKRKGLGRLVADKKNLPPYEQGYRYVPPNKFWQEFYSLWD